MKILLTNDMQSLNTLKLDVSIRKDNTSIGSDLGGNPTLYFLLLSNKLNFIPADNISIVQLEENSLTFNLPSEFTLLELRKAAEVFVDKLPKITEEQLIDLDWLSRQNQTNDIKLLTQCIQDTLLLNKSIQNMLENKSVDLSDKDIILINEINKMPIYIQAFCVRIIIGLNSIIKTNLDEHMLPLRVDI